MEHAPLTGLRLIDMTQYASGPMCSQVLGDLGAEVIKIERPGFGDQVRDAQPQYNNESPYFQGFNRNKKSITLDFTKPEGANVIKELVKSSDILVENYAPGAMKRRGLDYEVLSQINPALIMCSITGFGQKDSPYVHKAAFDGVIQAMCGLMSATGMPDGEPMKVGPAIADVISGYYGAIGVLGALYERNISGKGQYIDIAMLDCGYASLEFSAIAYTMCKVVLPRFGNGHPICGATGCYKAKDGYVYVNTSSDKIAKNLAKAMGMPELLDDPRYQDNPIRGRNRDWLDPLIGDWMIEKTRAEVAVIFDSNGVPNGVVNTSEDCFKDPHFEMRGMLPEVEHPTAGKFKIPGSPLHFSRTPVMKAKAAPALGSSNDYVYKQLLKMTDEDVEKLKATKVVS